MIKLIKTDDSTTVQMQGDAFKVMAEIMLLLEKVSSVLKQEDPALDATFKHGIAHWAKGGFDD